MGYTVFDSLVFWDLSRSDAPSRLVPNLAHLNARAMSPRVRGFVQARNWFQDLGPVSMG